ncbi:ATP-dependent DNA ligase [Rhodococcus sp. OK302]|uniref:ATP-dependent DNA ligase n=1 Tax=Rhodococcus sp. OK302 TaxID=1882769 RepID=UPI000B940C09|nr:ATP-dependent DNA ligase [Rhodococcus sp. OK302]OYD68460.1 ATP-dependent DNA ligase LigD ligase module /ATP-dependent DNA ligase LigD phosphoesterase module /ATP-dependent DNA ligase LigD polymerase module [Rhodococcus sp. OK302]
MATTDRGQITLGGITVPVTNLGKVLYPESGTTKAEVIDYYTRISAVMIAHVVARPGTRKRWPNGVDGQSFFEKNLASSAPAWLTRASLQHSDRVVTYPIFDSVASLAWLGQQAALELHVPQWRFDGSGRGPATRLVFDLDPGEGVGLAECAEVARWIRDLVGTLGWTAYPVTSGSKGIHLYVPLDRPLEGNGASTVAKQVATGLEKIHPELVTATMARNIRAGKVFVDWSQNNAAKTTIAPYSMRGRAQPYVAAPRSWEELDDPTLQQLLFDEVLERVESGGDLLSGLDPAVAVSDSLSRYRSKRSAARTPEPVPRDEPAPTAGNSFVIQEHHARRLHYDVRLERNGVLVSWAVPKGVPTAAGENRLAVHTEDHPMEYATFSGVIPKGEYGGGSMTIWDSGTYETEKWRDDEVIVWLAGERVQGRFALIRTKGDQWLMHLMKDQNASFGTELPKNLEPMLATAGSVEDLDTEEWAFEGKWDGIRVILEYHSGALSLRSRAGNDKTADYPALAYLGDILEGHEVVIDGEVVAYDPQGVTDFGLLQRGGTPEFLAFDLLYLDGVSLLRKSYTDRRTVLNALAAKVGGLNVPPQIEGTAENALEVSRESGWEGIVAKRRASVYLPGRRGSSWIKVKNWRTQEVVIGGWRTGQGNRAHGIGALLMGIPGENGLNYVGRVGTGFTDRDLEKLLAVLEPLQQNGSPFAEELPADDRKGAVWISPELVGEVRFMDWTESSRLRHPSWRGLRDDKMPADVKKEEVS